jgi:iron complex outermembrane receptor protein
MRCDATAAFCAAALLGGAARAADTVAPQPAAASPTGQGPVLEQIIVTAKKRSQNVQNVPQTVDVVGGTTLKKLNVLQFQDIQSLVSGLTLSDNGGQGQNISLRGITYDPDTAANPAVDIYFNEVPLFQTSSAFQDLYDVQQVEVVRGPQGTLRGRTSPAGAILIDTVRPDLDKWGGYVQQVFATDGQVQTQLAAGGPIVRDKLAVRIAGLFDQNDVYDTHDETTGKTDFNLQHSYRMTVTMKPTDALDVVLTQQESNDRTRELFGVTGDGTDGAISPAANLAVEPGPYLFYDRTSLTTLQANYHFDANELSYVGGYQSVKDEFQEEQDKGNLFANFYSGAQQDNEGLEQFTQELRFQSSGEQRLGYMVGAYYAHQDAIVGVFTPSEYLFVPAATKLGVAPLAIVDADVKIPDLTTDYAIFTDETFKVTPDDVIEGGLRWQLERQYRSSTYVAYIPEIFGGGIAERNVLISPQNQKAEYRAFTGLFSYTHHFSSKISIYTSYGESFRPGGVVLGNSLPLPEQFLLFKPETSYDFEIGAKSELFDGRVRLNADIFHQAYSGYIGRQPNLLTNLGYATLTTNGNAIARGAEFSADAFVTDDWRLGLNMTFDDSHYDNARLPCNDFNGSGSPNTDGPPHVPAGQTVAYCTVNASLGEPNWFVSANTEYDVTVNDRMQAFVRALYTFTPRNHLGLQDVNEDPRNIANIYLGLRGSAGWEGYFFVKNLFDTVGYANLFGEQYDAGFKLPNTSNNVDYDTGYRSSAIARPRQFGLSLSYRF